MRSMLVEDIMAKTHQFLERSDMDYGAHSGGSLGEHCCH